MARLVLCRPSPRKLPSFGQSRTRSRCCATRGTDGGRGGGISCGDGVPTRGRPPRAGLELADLQGGLYEPVRNREERLGKLANSVEDGNLKRYGEDTTWTEVADEMRRLIVSLEKRATVGELIRWKCLAALAYMHEGRSDDADSLLGHVEPRPQLELSLQALWDIAKLGNLTTDDRRLTGTEGLTAIEQLTSDIEQLRLKDEDSLLGRCLGTLGRAYVHRRNPVRALPFLREAVAEHKRDPRMSHETARSRVYLSMALRADGDLSDALLNWRSRTASWRPTPGTTVMSTNGPAASITTTSEPEFWSTWSAMRMPCVTRRRPWKSASGPGGRSSGFFEHEPGRIE